MKKVVLYWKLVKESICKFKNNCNQLIKSELLKKQFTTCLYILHILLQLKWNCL